MSWVVAEIRFSINNNNKNPVVVMEGWHGKEAVTSCCLILFFPSSKSSGVCFGSEGYVGLVRNCGICCGVASYGTCPQI